MIIEILLLALSFVLAMLLFWTTGERRRLYQANVQLQKERNFNNSIIDTMPAILCRINTEGICTFINPAGEFITGYTQHEIIGKNWWDLLYPGDQYRQVEILLEIFEQGQVRDHEMILTNKNNQQKIISWNSLNNFKNDQSLGEIIGFGLDLTEHRKAEQDLRDSERNFSTLSESMTEMVVLHEVVFDHHEKAIDYRILDCNKAFQSITGIPKEKVIGKLGSEVYELQYAPYLHEFCSVGITGQSKELNVFFKPMGKHFIISAVSPKPNHFVTITTDISAMKIAEEELKKARNYISNIVNSMPSMLIGVDTDGKINEWNKEAERVTNFSPTQVFGANFIQVFPRFATEAQAIKKAIKQREILYKPRFISKHNNNNRYEDITIYPLVSNGLEGAVIRIDDVTQRVQLEEMMVQSEKMLSVGGLAAGMAHEINNPLGGMIQTANVLYDRLTQIDLPANQHAAEQAGISMEMLSKYMEIRDIPSMITRIRESGGRAAKIVSNMLDFARTNDFSFSSHDIVELLDQSIELACSDYDLKKTYDFKSITINKQYQPALPVIPCDASKIQQVLLNILRNAAQALHGGKIKDPIITIRIKQYDEKITVEIEDNGPGMKPEIKKQIFDPFFTTKPIGEGTGLGLSVSYFIITENHNGMLYAKSTEDVGTCFTIELPIKNQE